MPSWMAPDWIRMVACSAAHISVHLPGRRERYKNSWVAQKLFLHVSMDGRYQRRKPTDRPSHSSGVRSNHNQDNVQVFGIGGIVGMNEAHCERNA